MPARVNRETVGKVRRRQHRRRRHVRRAQSRERIDTPLRDREEVSV